MQRDTAATPHNRRNWATLPPLHRVRGVCYNSSMRKILTICAAGWLAGWICGAPVIEQLAQATAPASLQAVTIYCAVADSSGIISIVLVRYTANAWLNQASIQATQSAGKVYLGTLPGLAANSTAQYTVTATALDGTSSSSAPTNTYIVRAATATSIVCRIMAANTTSGNYQAYENPGIRIFQGLTPDVVAIQEFNYQSGTIRQLIDTAFGTNFYYYRGAGGSIPNGIVSRWPIIASGDWPSPVAERDFSWATIDLPGTIDLHVVSVHLPTSSAANRSIEATMIKTNVLARFPASDYIVVGGDMNTDTRTEAAIVTFNTFLSNAVTPVDQNSNDNTSAPRSKPYDWTMPNPTLAARLVPTITQARTFNNGLVYDSRVTTPYQLLPSPILAGDSGVSGMQHMAVVKDFLLSGEGTADSAPSLRGASNCVAYIGNPFILQVIAADAATQQISMSCSDSARFSATPGFGAVTGVYTWTLANEDFGNHATVFTASADGLAAQVMINILVVPEAHALACLAWIAVVFLRGGRQGW